MYLLCSESLLLANIAIVEGEMEGLYRTVTDLKDQLALKDKACSDAKKLRDTISAQNVKVRISTATMNTVLSTEPV